MTKNRSFPGQPLFSQILSLIPKDMVSELTAKYKSNRYCKRFYTHDHLVSMLYCCFSKCESLREVISGLQVNHHRLAHFGLGHTPRRSTLAEANLRRSSALFSDLFHSLYEYYFQRSPDSFKGKGIMERLFLLDSTTISLFSEVMKGAGTYGANGKKKGGVKAHVLSKADQDVPCLVRLTEARLSDKEILKDLKLSKHSIVVMDKGYNNYSQFKKWTDQGVYYVTRMHTTATYRNIEERSLTQRQIDLGVLSGSLVEFGRPSNYKQTPLTQARLVVYHDKEKDRIFHFITNEQKYSPSTIANIYKRRWQIELLFKRVKGNSPLRYFLGESRNAIEIQVWCALIADLLVKVIKDRVTRRYGKRWSFSNLSAIIRLHLATYVDIYAFLKAPEKSLIGYQEQVKVTGQLQLALDSS